jgi:hypothetical protein
MLPQNLPHLQNPLFLSQLEKFSSLVNQTISGNTGEVTVKDLTTMIRIFTRLEEHFINDFNGYFDFGVFLIQRILDLSSYISQLQLYSRAPYWEDLYATRYLLLINIGSSCVCKVLVDS